MSKIIISIALILISFIISCNQAPETNRKKAKYIFYFIGDGASLPQLSLTEAYLARISGQKGMKQLYQSRLNAHGWFYTFADNRFITGSAAAGTALATGNKTSINTIGMSSDHSKNYKSIAFDAKKQGLKVGIISTVSINHATPAAFYANVKHRKNYYQIGQQLFTSGFDLFAGGAIRNASGKEGDKPNLYQTKSDYSILRNNKDFLNAEKKQLPLIYSHERLSVEQSMPYAIDKNENDLTLTQIVEKSISLLNNENGFFMMIEGGKIDWACHANDAATTIKEMIDYDNAIGKALEFAKLHPNETLIIALGDHETGGLGLGNTSMKYSSNLDFLQHQTSSFEALMLKLKPLIDKKVEFYEAKNFIQTHFGLFKNIPVTKEEEKELKILWNKSLTNQNKDTKLLYGTVQEFLFKSMQVTNKKAGIGWTTMSHTGLPVVVHASGVGAENFEGILDNTDIPKIIKQHIQ